ncbi:MAG: DNA methyltransferase [Candidatus Woesearchaeota archaeon]
MTLLFLLSKENLNIAKAEVEALIGEKCALDKNIALFEEKKIKTNKNFTLNVCKRAAYTHGIFNVLFISNYKNIEKDIKKFNWNKIYKKSFVVRKTGYNKSLIKKENEYAKFIWQKINNPKVNLNGACTKIFLVCGKKVYVCLMLCETDKSYLLRKPHLRPYLHPTSLNPKLARAMVNFTGANEEDVICDPFCGSGGILIEAGLMGIKTIGIDISEKMLKMAAHNLKHYKIKNFKLIKKDATKIKINANYVVTDLPYGKGSKITERLEDLYFKFLKNLKNSNIKKSIIGFPNFVNYKKLVKKSGLKIENQFEQYIHKNLSKIIIILKR